jgi:hypothetical protein
MQSWLRESRQLPVLVLAVAALVATAVPVTASPELIGIVLDFKPRKLETGKPAIVILRNGKTYPVREHEMIYQGDKFVFDKSLGTDANVKALVDSSSVVTVTAAQPELPSHTWPSLQGVAAKLVTAYRWINPSGGEDKSAPRNAISRGDEALSVLPNVRAKLMISDKGNVPLWIGWTGGKAPFVVTLSTGGKKIGETRLCDHGPDQDCSREVTFENVDEGPDALQLSVASADGASWSQALARTAVVSDAVASNGAELGQLGLFLQGTELLEKGHGEFVLESARKFSSIAKDYPPARVLLDYIRDGKIP